MQLIGSIVIFTKYDFVKVVLSLCLIMRSRVTVRYHIARPPVDEAKASFNSWQSVGPRLCLPGVACPVCGKKWAMRGIQYPSLELATLANAAEYVAGNVALDELERLRGELRQPEPEWEHLGRRQCLL